MCLTISMSFSAYAEVSSTDVGHVLSLIQPKKYTSYCGNDAEEKTKGYKKGNWQSARDCLTDGRVHLVYANTADGKHGQHQLERKELNSVVQFNDDDKNNLLNAIYEGAQVYVGEANHMVFCVESAIHKDATNDAVCSTTDRIFADWTLTGNIVNLEGNKHYLMDMYDAEYNRYLTSGHREFHHIHLNDTLANRPIGPNSNASAEEKKNYAAQVLARSRVVSQQALRWYIRY